MAYFGESAPFPRCVIQVTNVCEIYLLWERVFIHVPLYWKRTPRLGKMFLLLMEKKTSSPAPSDLITIGSSCSPHSDSSCRSPSFTVSLSVHSVSEEPIPAQKSTAVYRYVRLSEQDDKIQLAEVRRYRVSYYNVQSAKRLPPLRRLMAPKGWKSLGYVPPTGLVTVYSAAAWKLRTAVAAGPMSHLLISDRLRRARLAGDLQQTLT